MVVDSYVSIRDEIRRITQASASRDHWAVLGIPPESAYAQIKNAQRKWVRKLHPDRWYAVADEHLREEILEAYYKVQVAYFEALKHCLSSTDAPIITSTTSKNSLRYHFLNWLSRLLGKI